MKKIAISQMIESSGVQFGTSGARGLVNAMTDEVCYLYACAFLQHLRITGQYTANGVVAIGGDLRTSTPRICGAVIRACSDSGFRVVYAGQVPTPALAHFGLRQKIPCMMVTGSHIPEDRNGIKFYTPSGEILKSDETGISAQVISLDSSLFNTAGGFNDYQPLPEIHPEPMRLYLQRYTDFFPPGLLEGKSVGVYQHSSVARQFLVDVTRQLGANAIALAPSSEFVSVDTEAIRPEDVALAQQWAAQHQFDAIISADGDGDRPLVADEHGDWIRGDVAGVLVAKYLHADIVVTPVSSNSMVESSNYFGTVTRTRIGSPYVIEQMYHQCRTHPAARVVGYEANGGFLTATDIHLNGFHLSALPTRDATIVPLAIIALALLHNKSLSGLVATLPSRFTASDRMKNFPTKESLARIQRLRASREDMEDLFNGELGTVSSVDTTDGLRITYGNGEIVHLRPSGNAPELRCYTEAGSAERADKLARRCMDIFHRWAAKE